jgi:hypothetical protein
MSRIRPATDKTVSELGARIEAAHTHASYRRPRWSNGCSKGAS